MKTTKEAAEILGIKPAKLASILKAHPSYKPPQKFQRSLVWTDTDIEKAEQIVAFVQNQVCPHCGRTPDGNTTREDAVADAS